MMEQTTNEICIREGHFLAHVSGLGRELAQTAGWGTCQRCGQKREPLLDGPTIVFAPARCVRRRSARRKAGNRE